MRNALARMLAKMPGSDRLEARHPASTLKGQVDIKMMAYSRPKQEQETFGSSVLLGNLDMPRNNQFLRGPRPHSCETKIHVPISRDGVGQSPSAVVAVVKKPCPGFLQVRGTGSDQRLWQATDLQRRPGLAVHQLGFCRNTEKPKTCRAAWKARTALLSLEKIQGCYLLVWSVSCNNKVVHEHFFHPSMPRRVCFNRFMPAR